MDTKHRRNSWVRKLYVQYIRSHISKDINRQRLKLLWFIWGYYHLMFLHNLSLFTKAKLFWRFLLIDWNILHAHKPSEISIVCKAISERPARNGETVVEAGCFNGGSSAKFSIICFLLGYHFCIYDSFEGVEEMSEEEKIDSFDFSGQYAATEEKVQGNIKIYGEISVCSFYKGWFADTLARTSVSRPVRVAYIDCDVAKGTREALQGIVPVLVKDGWIFSQDFHIKPIIRLLSDSSTWLVFETNEPIITRFGEQLAGIRFEKKS